MSFQALLTLLSAPEDSDSLQVAVPSALSQLESAQFPSDSLSPQTASELVTAISEWILRFSASKRLSLLLSFQESLLKTCGLEEEINFLVEKEEATGVEALFGTAFASCLLSLLNSVISSAKLDKYSRILLTLLRIAAMTAPIGTIASAIRRKGILKQLLALFSSIVKQGAESESVNQLLHLLTLLLTKLAINHEKCRDYIVRKGAIQLATAFLRAEHSAPSQLQANLDLIYLIGSLAGNNDQQLLVWVANGIALVLSYYQKSAEAQSPAAEAVRSAALYVMWRLAINNAELQRDLKERKVDDIALVALTDSSAKMETIVFAVGVLRRLSSNNDYKAELSPKVAEPVLAQLAAFSRSKFSLLMKEAVACIGSISPDPAVIAVLLAQNIPELILDIAVRNLSALKLLKTCVGALVNMSLNGNSQVERCMDRIASNTFFYQLADGVLERHGDSAYFLDYTLRLLSNALANSTSHTDTSLYHLSNAKTVAALERALRCFPGDENIARYSIRILRTLLSVEKGREVVLTCLNGRETEVVEGLLNAFDAQVGLIDVVVETIRLLADLLTLPGSPYLPIIGSSPHFPKTMNAVLSHYRVSLTQNDREKLSVVTESLGALPVEDMGNPF